ncbi:hypothetical protein SAMN05216559_1664 [Halomicrobium zhouii]|uniref:Lipoprotein n=1 Tax=Halomicrobium zhouii TaxID=767519 RepID=A0A1I6KZH9_9EURY|nr:hypothetical protein [Halomicrobium zhouii]SFR96625.1 hypothetical protein SAMN05216559_1664 [Halomicrobium zhouii]
MHRRTMLARVSAGLGAVALAGCVADENGDEGTPSESETDGGDGNETDGGDGNETDDGDGNGTAVSLADASLSLVHAGCGQQTDEAAVAFEADAGEVVVTGTIWGSDACKTARLADASYHADADELVVLVATEDRSDEEEMCAECITELDYEVTAAFDGGLPGKVTVRHSHGDDPTTVSTATRD